MSLLRNRSPSQIEKGLTESGALAQLSEKYLGRGVADVERLKEELGGVLEGRKNELEALRVHRD